MEIEEKSGFTMTSLVAVLFAMVAFTPALIYLQLTIGSGSLPTTWFVVLLLVEAFKFGGRHITKQEAYVILGLAGGAGAYTGYLWWAWFVQSDVAQLFNFTPADFPSWLIPAGENLSYVWTNRTFFHPSWILPLSVSLLANVLANICALSLGFIGKRIFIETENLPFPMEHVSAQGIITITEGKKDTIKYLFSFATVGFIYGLILYAVPSMIEAWTGRRQVFMPIPWAQFEVEQLPGAVLGIWTDLGAIASAFVLPYNVIISVVIGSYAVWVGGNTLLVTYNLAPVPWWSPGMTLDRILQQSTLYFWAAPLIGIGLAVGVMPILHHPRTIGRAFRSLFSTSASQEGKTQTWRLLAYLPIIGWLGSALVGVSLYAFLAPAFPIWIPAVMIFILPMATTLISGRALGIAGVGVGGLTKLQSIAFLSTGYSNLDAWVVPSLSGADGSVWVSRFKVMQLTGTKIRSYLKLWILLIPLHFVFAIIFTQVFWTLAPMPSSAYPATKIFWPLDAINFSVWVRGRQQGVFNPDWILYGFIVGALIYGVSKIPILPFSALSYPALAVGACSQYPPYATTLLIGLGIRLMLTKLLGEEFWNQNKSIFSAGLLVGEGIAITFGVAMTLILHSIWTMPY